MIIGTVIIIVDITRQDYKFKMAIKCVYLKTNLTGVLVAKHKLFAISTFNHYNQMMTALSLVVARLVYCTTYIDVFI